MVGVSRYNAGGDETDILKNKLGITDPNELGDFETILLADSYEHFLELLSQNKLKLDLNLLFTIHKYFLEPLYSWAGKIRTVNISKENTAFASAQNIEASLKQLSPEFEANQTDPNDSKATLAKKLAFLHCELNAIHPFREGNGRTIRFFLDLLTTHAGYESVDFKSIPDEEYLNACKAGMLQNYEPMEAIYNKLLRKTTKK